MYVKYATTLEFVPRLPKNPAADRELLLQQMARKNTLYGDVAQIPSLRAPTRVLLRWVPSFRGAIRLSLRWVGKKPVVSTSEKKCRFGG